MRKIETVIERAHFNPSAKTYFVITSCLPFVFSIFGIVLLPIWIPIALMLANKWYDSLECVLTEKTLRFKKGVLLKVEKTIPLDKITDLGSNQGPIMRSLGIENMTIETAGSTTPGALLSLAGVVDPDEFREAVLDQKEKMELKNSASSESFSPTVTSTAPALDGEAIALLREIRDSLRNLEAQSNSTTSDVLRVRDHPPT